MQKRAHLLAPLSLLLALPSAYGQERPNIILIMADDLGWGDVGFNGNDIIETPHLDALASEGMIFDRFYSASAVSSPTRASVLTGRNPYRTGIYTANVGILRCEEVTIPELLAEEDYLTGHFGKWHLGSLTDKEFDANRGRVGVSNIVNPPALHGYDDSFVTESKVPTTDPMIMPENHDGHFWDRLGDSDKKLPYRTYYWKHDGTKETENLEGDDSRVIMDRVIPFIDSAREQDRPFLSVIWFHAPHLPCVATEEYAAMYEGMSVAERNYYGCITALDAQVGRLVEHLKSTGEYENSLIFFCSDNGPERGTPGVTGGFKERKRSLHEGGIRVPAFVVWPSHVKGGKRSSAPCFTSDYLPTVTDILKISNPTHALDGTSIVNILQGERERSKPQVFLIGDRGVIMDGDYKLYASGGVCELYNLRKDPYEERDLSQQYPSRVEVLKKQLESTIDNFRSSFDGDEYGTRSVEMLNQKWEGDQIVIED